MKMSDKQRSAFAEWSPTPNCSWVVPYNVVQRHAPQMLANSDLTYFSLPWRDILFTTVVWHTFNYRDVTHSPLPWCDILSTTVMWHTFHYRDVTYFQLPWCDIFSTSVMLHTFNYRDVTYFPLPWCDILQEISFFLLVEMTPTVHNSLNDWHDITEIDVICLIDIITQWNENVWKTKVRLRRVMTDVKF